MNSWNRSEYADRIRHAVQTILARNHVAYSCFLVTRLPHGSGEPFQWEIVAMTSRGKMAFTLETTAFDTEEELAAKAADSVERRLPSLACPTCKGVGFVAPAEAPVLHPEQVTARTPLKRR